MRVSAIHPLHRFVAMNLPAMPSLTGRGYTTVKCTNCGITALRREGDTFLSFFGSDVTDQMKLRFCVAATDERYGVLHVRITCNALHTRNNPAFAHLLPGTMHRVIPPPPEESGRTNGFWVAGPNGPAKVLEGEFLPVKVRDRHRAPRVLATGT